MLRNAAGRRAWFHGPRPIVVYVDAAGCGHLGIVIYVGGVQRVCSTHIPERMTNAKCDIYEMEMCASLYGLCWAAEEFADRAALL